MAPTLFTALADAFMAQGPAARGSTMGHPCLRSVPRSALASGAYFATGRHPGDALVVKPPEARVQEVPAGRGVPSAPARTPFRQWLEATHSSAHHAREVPFEALEFVAP